VGGGANLIDLLPKQKERHKLHQHGTKKTVDKVDGSVGGPAGPPEKLPQLCQHLRAPGVGGEGGEAGQKRCNRRLVDRRGQDEVAEAGGTHPKTITAAVHQLTVKPVKSLELLTKSGRVVVGGGRSGRTVGRT
jgi:hypothetical protein